MKRASLLTLIIILFSAGLSSGTIAQEDADCTVSPEYAINVRKGPGTNYTIVGALFSDDEAGVTGQNAGTDDKGWWALGWLGWVRSDIVTESGDCEDVPFIKAPAASTSGTQTRTTNIGTAATVTTTVPSPFAPQAPKPSPTGKTIIEYPVYNCTPLGNGQFKWWVVQETFVDGVSVGIQVIGDPVTGPWQPNCPAEWCGDGTCNGMETYYSCQVDCPNAPAMPAATTSADCKVDGICGGNETCHNCPKDCGGCGCVFNSANDCCADVCKNAADPGGCTAACLADDTKSYIQHDNYCWGCWCPDGHVCP